MANVADGCYAHILLLLLSLSTARTNLDRTWQRVAFVAINDHWSAGVRLCSPSVSGQAPHVGTFLPLLRGPRKAGGFP